MGWEEEDGGGERVMLHGLMERGKQTMKERDDGRMREGGRRTHCRTTGWQMAAAPKRSCGAGRQR